MEIFLHLQHLRKALGKTKDEWHTDDIRDHVSDIQVTKDYTTGDIRVHTQDIK